MSAIEGHTVTADLELTPDVCVIGSGAGGAVLAAGLIEQGLDVVLLEEGGAHDAADFAPLDEARAYPMLYQDRMMRATADSAIAILQGRSVGGSTTVNWTTCFRTPERILAHWQSEHGIELGDLGPHFDAVERRLGIGEWPASMANANNGALLRGATALGWHVNNLRRNVRGCRDSGYCGLGCAFDAKQAMGITYLRDAMDDGLALYADCRAVELEHAGGVITAVRAQILDRATAQPAGPVVTVRAKVTVVCGGAINTPLLLLRSGIDGGGRVGLRTMFHPVVGMAGVYPDRVDPWYGAPQSISSHEFVDRGDQVGFFLEAAPLQPMLASSALLAIGGDQIEFMKNLSHVSTLLSLSVDGLSSESQGGAVSLRSDGRPLIEYPVGPALQEAFLASHRAMAQVHLAAGALKTGTLHVDPIWLTDASQLDQLDTAPYGALEHSIFTAHQMGGCAMGADPAVSVVDTEHRVRGFDNLFVVDGSVLPTALGVNPSQTIYGLAHRARQFVGAAAGGRMPAPEPAAPEPAAPVLHKWPVPEAPGE